jgi:hypothetical protein
MRRPSEREGSFLTQTISSLGSANFETTNIESNNELYWPEKTWRYAVVQEDGACRR